MAPILFLGLVALAAWGLWTAARSRPVFVVRITKGVASTTRGTVTREFVHQIGETCRRHGVTEGVVRGEVKGPRIALAFSTRIPQPCQQQLRNLWAMSGWSVSTRSPH